MGIAARDWNINGTTVFALLPLVDGGRGGHRGPVRPDRAPGQAAHVHRDHDRLLLHLPADGVQLQLHRRVERPRLAVPELAGGDLQHALLLHRARLRGRHRRHRLAGPAIPVRPPAPGDQGRRGPGARPRRAGHAGEAVGVRDLGRDHGRDRRGLVLLHQPGRAADRLRPAVRPDPRADGVPRRLRVDLRRGPRRADHRAADALAEHPARVQRRLAERDPARRDLPPRRALPAARASSRPAASSSPRSGPGDEPRSPPPPRWVRPATAPAPSAIGDGVSGGAQ